MPEQKEARVEISASTPEDRDFLASVAHRFHPGETVSPRNTAEVSRFFADLPAGPLLSEPGVEDFVATIGGIPSGVVAIQPDSNYVTRHPRACVDVLVVTEDAEGKGVGRAVMRHAEEWVRKNGCLEEVLDIVTGNT